VIDLRELVEDGFERGPLHKVSEMLDGIAGGDFARAENEDGGAVRTVEDDFAARGERRRVRSMRVEVTSRPEKGSSRMRISGPWRRATERRIFWRMPAGHAGEVGTVTRCGRMRNKGLYGDPAADCPDRNSVTGYSGRAHLIRSRLRSIHTGSEDVGKL